MAKRKRTAKSGKSAPRGRAPETEAPAGLSDQIDRNTAAEAYQKVMRGETPSLRERQALARYEPAREEKLRWQYYRSIPLKHWRQMSGRQTKILQEQAGRYGIPFGSAKIDLPAVVKALHDFLSTHGARLARAGEAEYRLIESSPALERYREERAKLARIERLEREGSVIPRGMVHEVNARLASILRRAGEALQRQFGPDAAMILNDALEDFARVVETLDDGQKEPEY
jgi:hypothetical protein